MIDPVIVDKMGEEFYRLYKDAGITKILTVEASGIAIAYAAARYLGCPLVYAKKHQTSNITADVYASPVSSFTHGKTYNVMVSKEYLLPTDNVLVIDDFLAIGNALVGLFSIVEQAGAEVIGAGIAVEKVFQGGGNMLRQQGMRVESLAMIASMDDTSLTFC